MKLFQNYFSDTEHVGKYSWAAIIFRNNSEIISGKFPRAEIKLFQIDVDEGQNNFEIILPERDYVAFGSLLSQIRLSLSVVCL